MDFPEPDRAAPAKLRTIVILREEPFGFGFDVTVNPPQTVGHDRHFISLAAARQYARHLADRMGWGLADLSGEE